jgi:hypothetical protein
MAMQTVLSGRITNLRHSRIVRPAAAASFFSIFVGAPRFCGWFCLRRIHPFNDIRMAKKKAI